LAIHPARPDQRQNQGSIVASCTLGLGLIAQAFSTSTKLALKNIAGLAVILG
jgi:hypothetical protein